MDSPNVIPTRRQLLGQAVLPALAPFFDQLLTITDEDRQVSTHRIEFEMIPKLLDARSFANVLKPIIRNHYPQPHVYRRQLQELGDVTTAALIQTLLPMTHKVRAGELGEILMSEFIERALKVPVPVKKLRNKDGRDNPIRGVDSLGVIVQDGELLFVKGEAKVHRYLTTRVVNSARAALNEAKGSVSRYTALYVVQHGDPQDIDLHRACEAAAYGRRTATTYHLLFAGYERLVVNALADFTRSAVAGRRTYAVGVKLLAYRTFISDVYRIAGEP